MGDKILHGIVHLFIQRLLGELIQINGNTIVRINCSVAEAAEMMVNIHTCFSA